MPYSKIDRRIWTDERFARLSNPSRLLMFYLLTTPHIAPLPGVIQISEEGMAADMGWSVEQCRQRLEELKWFVKPFPELHYFWVKNAIKYDLPANENVLKSQKKHLEMLPSPLKFEVKRTYKRIFKLLKPEFVSSFDSNETVWQTVSKPFKNQKSFCIKHQHQHQHQQNALTAVLAPEALAKHSTDVEFQHNCFQAADWVCNQLGFVGPAMHKLINNCLQLEYQVSHEELSTIAEYMVRTRRYYDEIVRRKGTGFLYSPKSFFEQGIWKSSRLWRDHKSNGDATTDTTDTTNDDETD